MLKASADAPRAVHVESVSAGKTEVWDAVVEDDYRYSAKYAVNGTPQYAEVDYDDGRVVQLQNLGLLGQAQSNPLAATLAPERWVTDLDQAPPDFLSQKAVHRILDPRDALDVVHSFDEFTVGERATLPLLRSRKWDPKSQLYVKRDDKFTPNLESGIRYDYMPQPYSGTTLFTNGIPTDMEAKLRDFFLYIAFWFKDGRVTRIEENFLPDAQRIRRDLSDQAKRSARDTGIATSNLRLPEIPAPFHKVISVTYKPGTKVSLPTAAGAVKLSALGPAAGSAPPAGPAAPPGGAKLPGGATVPGGATLPGGQGLPSGQGPSTSTTRRSP
jgi:hypothetical protein